MKIKLYRLPNKFSDDKYVILTNYMSRCGRTCDDTFGSIYPRRYFETSDDPIHDCWGGDDISNMCDGTPELITEVEAINNLSDEEIYNNIESFIDRAKSFAQTVANEAFAEKLTKAVKKGVES